MKEYGCKKENTYETKVNIQVSTNRKQKDLIEENYNNKKNKILLITCYHYNKDYMHH